MACGTQRKRRLPCCVLFSQVSIESVALNRIIKILDPSLEIPPKHGSPHFLVPSLGGPCRNGRVLGRGISRITFEPL
jgi:hypothetical protein